MSCADAVRCSLVPVPTHSRRGFFLLPLPSEFTVSDWIMGSQSKFTKGMMVLPGLG